MQSLNGWWMKLTCTCKNWLEVILTKIVFTVFHNRASDMTHVWSTVMKHTWLLSVKFCEGPNNGGPLLAKFHEGPDPRTLAGSTPMPASHSSPPLRLLHYKLRLRHYTLRTLSTNYVLAIAWSTLIIVYGRWLSGVVARSQTSDSEVTSLSPTRTTFEFFEQVIYTSGAQANSAFHPSGVGKWVAISIW